MKPNEVVFNQKLRGVFLTSNERDKLLEQFPGTVPAWLLDLCAERNLAGSTFSLDDESDLSGMGVELKWMSAEQMIDETVSFYPGIAAIKKRYLPFGICLEGSGDPYFLKIGKGYYDTPVVRIYHDILVDGDVDESAIDIVALNLVEFFEKSTLS